MAIGKGGGTGWGARALSALAALYLSGAAEHPTLPLETTSSKQTSRLEQLTKHFSENIFGHGAHAVQYDLTDPNTPWKEFFIEGARPFVGDPQFANRIPRGVNKYDIRIEVDGQEH